MSDPVFAAALMRLWPDGDVRVVGLRAGIAAAAGEVFARHGIAAPLTVAHVMAQISHECGAGRDVVENMNYTARRMTQVWPTRFPTEASAQPYAGHPRALANKVYNGRMGNRAGSDDGWTFRGRGGAQTTGREGYQRVAAATGLDVVAQPELLIDPRSFLACAVADFIACGCLPYAVADDVVGVTRRLNGGTIGLAARKAWLARWTQDLRGMSPLPRVSRAPPLASSLPAQRALPPTAGAPGTAAPVVVAAPPLAPSLGVARSGVASLVAALRAAFRRT